MDELKDLESLTDDEKIEELGILNLQDDDKKIESLEKLNYDYYKVKVINTLQSDDKKIEALEKLNNDCDKANVIETLQDDDKKIEALEKLNYDDYKVKVINTLQSDDKKIQALEKLNNDFAKANVIETLQDDDKKIELLEKLNNDFAKANVIETLQDDDKKIELLEKLNNDALKANVIATLQSDDKKIESLEKLGDDSAKANVIATLQSDDKKIDLLEILGDDFTKANVIATLQDDDKRIDLLEKLKETFLYEKRMYSEIGLDKKITIGMEIESEGVMSSYIQKLKKVVIKQVDGETKVWETERDGSLDEGVEIVSPILTDNKEDVEDIYIVCSMLQKCGNKVSERCGGHIHIGADYLRSKEAYVNLFEIWGNAEKIICKMSNEIGTIPRIGLQKYASPISPKLNEAIERGTINLENEEDLEQFINEIQEVQESRYSGLNLFNINNGKNTIEFRISNGTINPNTWIENARLYGRIVQISQKLAEIEKQPEHSKEDKKLLELKEKLKEEILEQDKMEILLELLFSEGERKIYRERYISCSELLEQISDEKNSFQETKFSRVDFKKKKQHSLDEFHDVAVNGRSQTIDATTRETVQGVRTQGRLVEQIMEEK